MCRKLRKDQFDPSQVGILHVMQRCVRRAFLTGDDAYSGNDYSHRKEMLRLRMESLASVYAIDVFTYAIQANHFHMLIQNRPDIVECWDDWHVATNWLRIYPGKRVDQDLGVPTDNDIESLVQDSERIQVLRLRLSDPSWYMKSLCEPIAKRCNREDNCTGHFWEGRFKAQQVLDTEMLIATNLYVDLNPMRARAATTLESSIFTGAYDRLVSLQGVTVRSAALDTPVLQQEDAAKLLREESVENLKKLKAANRRGTGRVVARDAWLAPMQLAAMGIPVRKLEPGFKEDAGRTAQRGFVEPMVSTSGLRPSDRGFLSFSVREYLMLLDWCARQPGRAGQAVIDPELEPLIVRLGMSPAAWGEVMRHFAHCFRRSGVIGSPQSMRTDAKARGLHHYHGQGKLVDVLAGKGPQSLAGNAAQDSEISGDEPASDG